jgi:hypothetical protein
MGAVLLTAAPLFPQDTIVGAYRKRHFAGGAPQPGDEPRGPVTETATVDALGDLAFEELLDDERYYVGAEVSGAWRWKSFTTPPGP